MEIHCQYRAPTLLITCNANTVKRSLLCIGASICSYMTCIVKRPLVQIQKRGPVGKTVCLEDCKLAFNENLTYFQPNDLIINLRAIVQRYVFH